MLTDVVLDSTAIASIFFRDPYSERVDSALKKFERFHTLDLAFAEVGSVAWKRVKFFGEDYAASLKALAAAAEFIENACRVTESRELVSQAFELGVERRITFYDSLFIALANGLKARLLTTDERLRSSVQAMKELSNLILVP